MTRADGVYNVCAQEEVVDAVVLPVLAPVEEDTDSVVKRRVFQLLIDVATVCPSRFLEIVENLRQVSGVTYCNRGWTVTCTRTGV